MAVWYFLDICFFLVIWYIFLRLGMFYQEKSGNPGTNLDLRDITFVKKRLVAST
jgi:hypothetical protein